MIRYWKRAHHELVNVRACAQLPSERRSSSSQQVLCKIFHTFLHRLASFRVIGSLPGCGPWNVLIFAERLLGPTSNNFVF